MTLTLLALVACRPADVWVRPDAPVVEPGVLAVAPAVLLVDVPGVVASDPFLEGYLVGHVRHEGGFVLDEGLSDMVVSAVVDVGHQEDYGRLARAFVDTTLEAILPTGPDAPRVAVPASAWSPPERTPTRGEHPDDGRDNVNLPRYTLKPSPFHAEALALAGSADGVLLTAVVQYYSHNGGWFVGQRWGCAAGARVRLLWAVADPSTGAVTGWGEVEARHLADDVFQPTTAASEQHLLEAEAAVARAWAGQLGR